MAEEWIGRPLGADSAAEVMAAMGRLTASQLRELAPQPFGLVNDEPRLLAFVGFHSLQGSAGQALLTRMTLCYGKAARRQSRLWPPPLT
jgi:hypothetical protein